jgi:hypothetical protein
LKRIWETWNIRYTGKKSDRLSFLPLFKFCFLKGKTNRFYPYKRRRRFDAAICW